MLAAVDRGHPCIHFDGVDDCLNKHGYEYYLKLLALRRYEGVAFAKLFERTKVRQPTEGEFAAEMKK